MTETNERIREHRRFALRDVTLSGVLVGGATVDLWRDAAGIERWSARLLMPIAQPLGDGMLSGTTAAGERLVGLVSLGDTAVGPRRGRDVLAQLHGEGPLRLEHEPGRETEPGVEPLAPRPPAVP
jgi:hypothetical protein